MNLATDLSLDVDLCITGQKLCPRYHLLLRPQAKPLANSHMKALTIHLSLKLDLVKSAQNPCILRKHITSCVSGRMSWGFKQIRRGENMLFR
jgi:hypothetical protein